MQPHHLQLLGPWQLAPGPYLSILCRSTCTALLALHDLSAAPCSWAAEHLRRNLTAKLPTAQPAQSHAATPPAAAQSLAVSTWPCLALQHSGLIIPAALQCMQWDGVLEVVLTSEALVTAAGSVTGLACMCEMLAALAAAGCTYAVVEAVRALQSGWACVSCLWSL